MQTSVIPLTADWADVQREVRALNLRLKQAIPRTSLTFDTLAQIQVRPGFLDGRRIERVIFFLKSNGCKWARDPEGAGGCAMCGHIAGTSRGQCLSSRDLIRQFQHGFANHDFFRFPMLCVYNSGSFLNPDELPADARRAILQAIAGNDDIERVIIESRPEFIVPEVLAEVASILRGKTVELGVGLETHDETIRTAILNKGVANDAFRGLKGKVAAHANLRLLFYVLVKPPLLSEGYALRDAVETVSYAFSIGADIVSLEPVSVQSFTLVDLLWRAGSFRPPWIWTVLEVVRQTFRPDRLIRIGGFEYYPLPREFVQNCPRCNTVFVKAIDRFNSVNELEVFNGIDCRCRRDEWLAQVESSAPPDPRALAAELRGVHAEPIIRQIAQEFAL
jgi:radical SAM enzyme (TIGR01210 family)